MADDSIDSADLARSHNRVTGRIQIQVGPPGWHERGETPKFRAEFASDYTWQAFSVFADPNNFSEPSTHTFVRAAADQLALLKYATDLVAREVTADRDFFLQSMAEVDLDNISHRKPLLVFRNMSYYTGLSTVLMSIKCGLDLYAKIVSAHIIPGKRPLDGFNRTKIDGNDLRGGHFLNWIAQQNAFPGQKTLCDAIKENIHDWIDKAIKCRDDAIHFGRIPGTVGSSIELTKHVADVSKEDIKPPEMPNGIPVHKYCLGLRSSYNKFLLDTLVLVPGIRLDPSVTGAGMPP